MISTDSKKESIESVLLVYLDDDDDDDGEKRLRVESQTERDFRAKVKNRFC